MAEETAPKDKAPEVNNRFVGKVQPNILDYYDTPTYNLKLYMIPEDERSAEILIEDDPRDDNPAGSGVVTEFQDQSAPPGKTVILAQTGVTAGAGIDNLELTSVSGSESVQTQVNFQIRQPNSVTFIDQIAAARTFCGGHPSDDNIPLFLEINFTGYDESDAGPDSTNPDFNVDAGGSIRAIAGPYIYPLIIRRISFNITEAGSTYDFECVVADDLAFADEYLKLPAQFETTGNNIQQHIEQLQQKINKFRESNVEGNKDNQFDDIEIQLQGLLAQEGEGTPSLAGSDETTIEIKRGGSPLISNQILVAPEIQETSLFTVKERDKDAEKTAEEAQAEASGDKVEEGETSGQAKKVPDMFTLIWKEGSDIYDCLGTLLSMNVEFMQKACRGDYKNGVNDEEITDATEVLWYKLKASCKNKGKYDEKTKKRYKTVIFKPMTYWETATDRNRLEAQIQAEVDAEATKRQIAAMEIAKAYHYFYTGRNDQILSLDISYQNGIAFLVPPQGGTVGDVYANNPLNFLTQPLDKDTLLSALGLDELFDLFSSGKKLFNSFKNLGETALNEIGEVAGLSPGQLKDFISNPKGAIAQGVANALTRTGNNIVASINEMISGGSESDETQTGVFTESDNERQKQIDQYYSKGNYDSSPSGYVYSADLVSLGPTSIDGQEALENMRNDVQSAIDEEESKVDGDEATESGKETVLSKYISGPADQGVYSGVQSTLFNYLYNNNKAEDFLIRLDMSVRGDPWFLGEPDVAKRRNPDEPKNKDKKDVFAGIHEDNSMFHLLEIAAPRYFDPNIYDEDGNTGEWGKAGFSYTLSGVYRFVKAINRFSGGMYSVDIQSVKQTGISLSKLTGGEYMSGQIEPDELAKTFDELEDSAIGQQLGQAFGSSWKNNPDAIKKYLETVDRYANIDEALADGYFTSEQGAAYKASQGGDG